MQPVAMQPMSETQARKQVMTQFEMHLHKPIGYRIRQRLTNYRYVLDDEMQHQERRAMVLVSSWGYYEYRLHRGTWAPDLLIVQRHDAVVPCAVFELESGMEYRPGSVPAIERKERRKRNHEEARLFVSKLLIGLDGAYQELRAMPPRTRQWYMQRCHYYLMPKIGRPWAS
jgi:hypothetical protein